MKTPWIAHRAVPLRAARRCEQAVLRLIDAVRVIPLFACVAADPLAAVAAAGEAGQLPGKAPVGDYTNSPWTFYVRLRGDKKLGELKCKFN